MKFNSFLQKFKMTKMDFRVFSAFTLFYTVVHFAYMLAFEWLIHYSHYSMKSAPGSIPAGWGMPREKMKYFNYVLFGAKVKVDMYIIVSVLSTLAIALLICYLITHLPKVCSTVLGLVCSFGFSRIFLWLLLNVEYAPGETLIIPDRGPLFWTEWATNRHIPHTDALKFMFYGFCLYLIIKTAHSCIIYYWKKKKEKT